MGHALHGINIQLFIILCCLFIFMGPFFIILSFRTLLGQLFLIIFSSFIIFSFISKQIPCYGPAAHGICFSFIRIIFLSCYFFLSQGYSLTSFGDGASPLRTWQLFPCFAWGPMALGPEAQGAIGLLFSFIFLFLGLRPRGFPFGEAGLRPASCELLFFSANFLFITRPFGPRDCSPPFGRGVPPPSGEGFLGPWALRAHGPRGYSLWFPFGESQLILFCGRRPPVS